MISKPDKPHDPAWCVNWIDYDRALRWYCVTLIKGSARR